MANQPAGERAGEPNRAALRARLEASRAEMDAALQGITETQLVRPPPGEVTEEEQRWSVRDVLWHVGMVEDWRRRMIEAAPEGRETERFEARPRPRRVDTLEMLAEWLEQTRRPTLALLERLDEAVLARRFTTPCGVETSVAAAFERVAEHEREHVAQVRDLLALPAEYSGDQGRAREG